VEEPSAPEEQPTSKQDEEEPTSPEQEAEEPSPPEKDELMKKWLDPLEDAADCFTYESIEEDSLLDLDEVGFEFNPQTDEFTFWHKLANLPAMIDQAPGYGGTGFWVEGTLRDEGSEWGPDRLINNSFNYVINEDGSIDFSRMQYIDPETGWEEDLDTKITGEIEEGVIFSTIPGIEIIPEDFDPSTGKIYVVAVTFDGLVCDFWGQDENSEPNQILDLSIRTPF
jgi:hypothetical protein